jgi:hypothetical protein
MANNTTSTKRRQPGRKAEDIRRAWKEQAPEALFAGKAVADFEMSITALQLANEDVAKLDTARLAALKDRDEKLAALAKLSNVVVLGVQGHAEFGDDSPLLRAMGYIPASERKSGLTRRSPAAKTAVVNKEAAA